MFRIQQRGQAETLVVVRGWAFDNAIFDSLDLPFNYAFYEQGSIVDFAPALATWLDRQDLARVHLFGWSMGAYAASDFALAQPERVGQVLLVGARQQYPPAEVDVVRAALHRNRRGFMRKFYKDCYAGHDLRLYRAFKQSLLPAYIDRWSVAELEADLDWICSRRLNAGDLDRACDLRIVHGQADRIVPLAEAQTLARAVQWGRFVAVPEAGHLPFLAPDLEVRLYAGV